MFQKMLQVGSGGGSSETNPPSVFDELNNPTLGTIIEINVGFRPKHIMLTQSGGMCFTFCYDEDYGTNKMRYGGYNTAGWVDFAFSQVVPQNASGFMEITDTGFKFRQSASYSTKKLTYLAVG